MRSCRYDLAQICERGHEITRTADATPQHRLDFCPKCGAKTTTECPSCGKPIRGAYLDGSWLVSSGACEGHSPYFGAMSRRGMAGSEKSGHLPIPCVSDENPEPVTGLGARDNGLDCDCRGPGEVSDVDEALQVHE